MSGGTASASLRRTRGPWALLRPDTGSGARAKLLRWLNQARQCSQQPLSGERANDAEHVHTSLCT